MKALETIKDHIKDLERMEGVFTFYGCFNSASECKKANKELTEAVAELEALQSRSCEGCKYGKERYWDWNSGRYDKDEAFECKRLDKSNQLTPYSKYEERKFYCSPTFCCNRYEPKEQ